MSRGTECPGAVSGLHCSSLDSAVNTVARISAPILLGMLYRRAGATACFYTAGGIVAAAACTAALRRILVLRKID